MCFAVTLINFIIVLGDKPLSTREIEHKMAEFERRGDVTVDFFRQPAARLENEKRHKIVGLVAVRNVADKILMFLKVLAPYVGK